MVNKVSSGAVACSNIGLSSHQTSSVTRNLGHRRCIKHQGPGNGGIIGRVFSLFAIMFLSRNVIATPQPITPTQAGGLNNNRTVVSEPPGWGNASSYCSINDVVTPILSSGSEATVCTLEPPKKLDQGGSPKLEPLTFTSEEKSRWEGLSENDQSTILMVLMQRDLVETALTFTPLIKFFYDPEFHLQGIFYRLVYAGSIDRAISFLNYFPKSYIAESMPGDIAKSLMEGGNIERAKEFISSISNKELQDRLLSEIEGVLHRADNNNRVLEAAELMPDGRCPITKAAAWLEVGNIDRVLSIANSNIDERERDWILTSLLRALMEGGDIERALTVANLIPNERSREESLLYIFDCILEGGNIEKALTLASKISSDTTTVRLVKQKLFLAQWLIAQFPTMMPHLRLEAETLISTELYKWQGLSEEDQWTIVMVLTQRDLLHTALALAPHNPLEQVFFRLIYAGSIDKAISLLPFFYNENIKVYRITYIANCLSKGGNIERAKELILSISDERLKRLQLSDIDKDEELAANSDTHLNAAVLIPEGKQRDLKLSRIAYNLLNVGNIEKASSVADLMNDQSDRNNLLKDFFYSALYGGNIESALTSAYSIPKKSLREWLLSFMFNSLLVGGNIERAQDLVSTIYLDPETLRELEQKLSGAQSLIAQFPTMMSPSLSDH